MAGRLPRDQWPWWVKVGLIGSPSRKAMWAWVAASIVFGVAAAAYGLTSDRLHYTIGGAIGGGVAALMYWLTIRWIDRHGSWEELR